MPIDKPKKPSTPFLNELPIKIKELFKDVDKDFNKIEVKISDYAYPQIDITISKMYGFVELSVKHLLRLADLVGTDEIKVNQYSHQGCETCDYGSSYEHTFTFTVPENKR